MTVKPSNFGDMPVDEFKKYGYRIVDQIAEYFENIEQYPVLSQVEPDWLKDNLPASAPETGEDFGDILDDVIAITPIFTAFFQHRPVRSEYSPKCLRPPLI